MFNFSRLEYGLFRVVEEKFLRRSPEDLMPRVVKPRQDYGPIVHLYGPRGEVPGSQYRPRQVSILQSYTHYPETLTELQKSRDALRAEMDRMPGGAPQTIEDMERLLPYVNPTGDQWNCLEVSMAIDDIQAGHAAVAGRSEPWENTALGFDPKPGPPWIEHEMKRNNARGIVYIRNPTTGQGHALNIRNFSGKVWWIDGQVRWGPDGVVKGGELTGVTDHCPYPQDYIDFALFRHAGSEAW